MFIKVTQAGYNTPRLVNVFSIQQITPFTNGGSRIYLNGKPTTFFDVVESMSQLEGLIKQCLR